MVKPVKKSKTANVEHSLLASLPWSCTHFGGQSEIEAYIDATGKWETIATVNMINDIDAEDVASFIVQHINRMNKEEKHG